MTPRTGSKLYLLGGLSILSLVLAALVFFRVIAAENRSSIGFQYLVVGVLLATLFLYFDGFSWLKAGLGIEGSPTSTSRELVSTGRGFEQSTQNPLEPSVRWNVANEVIVAVKQRERQLVDRLIEEGLLTIEGPITDRDVGTMAWVAVNSIELADSLLHGVVDQTWAEIPPPTRALPRAEMPE